MATKTVTVKVLATDAASPVFKKIGTGAKAMGDEVTTSSKRSAESLKQMQDRATALGAGIGTMIGGMSRAGSAFVAQETQIRGLTRAYGDSTDTILKFSEELQRNTVYSNDAARQSAIYASSLIQNYGLTADQIAVVIQRSADLAAVNVTAQGTQIELTDAVARTSAALRGEAEAGELLGLSMSDTFLKAEALKRGIQGWGTTMTEAEKAQFRLTIMLEQSEYAMGAAAEQADTSAGKAKQLMNQVQDLTQEFGGALGPMGEYLSVLGDMALAAPLVGAGLGRIAAGLTAIGGVKALGPLAVLLGGGALAYGYSQDQAGSTAINTAANEFFKAASQAMNFVLPGSPYDTKKYDEQMAANNVADAILAVFGGEGGIDAAVTRANAALDNPAFRYTVDPLTGKTNVFNYDLKDLEKYIQQAAAAAGVTAGEYLLSSASSSGALVLDPVTGTYKTPQELTAASLFRNKGSNTVGAYTMGAGGIGAYVPVAPSRYYGDITSGGYTGPFQPTASTPSGGAYAPPTYLGGTGYGVTSGPFTGAGADTATGGGADISGKPKFDMAAYIKDQSDAYYGLATAEEAASRGLSEFKAVQDSILEREGVYSQQISEFSSQVGAQDAAYEILNKRREEGIDLTDRETQFLDNYAQANERGTGAVEDATIAQGMLAQQYLLNMEKGDELNRTIGESSDSISDLVTVIQDLILAMDGVPEEVRTRIELERAQALFEELSAIQYALNMIAGTYVATIAINQIGGNAPSGPQFPTGMDGLTMNAYAGGGTHYGGGNWAIVGERGPEGVWLPNGSQVMNTEGSRSRFGGGGGINLYGPITVVANNPQQFGHALREYRVGSSR